MKRYIHFKPFANVKNVHSLIRTYYPKPCIGFESGSLMIVQSERPPLEPQGLQTIEDIGEFPFSNGDRVSVSVTVCFDNRGRTLPVNMKNQSGGRYKLPTYLNKREAREKFSDLAGLIELEKKTKTEGVVCQLVTNARFSKFNAHNVFRIAGEYMITDSDLFEKAYLEGLGSRKSYGFGMIFLEQAKEIEESDEQFENNPNAAENNNDIGLEKWM